MKLATYLLSCPNDEEAEQVSLALVENNLAACVKRTEIKSVYRWEGEVKHGEESLVIIETSDDKFDQIVELLNVVHSDPYYVLNALPASDTTPGVIDWLKETTS